MGKNYGSKKWVFPDGDRPFEGDFDIAANERLIILNTSDSVATVKMTIYFTDRAPLKEKILIIQPERVRCFNTNDIGDMDGFEPGYRQQYAIILESDTEIVAQYLKICTDNQPMHVYGMMGFGCNYIE